MSAPHLRGVDLNLLVILDDLLETESTVVTARRLGRTQSAISHSLARLRQTFGDPLFVRVGPSLRPTPAAQRMRAPLKEVLTGAESLIVRSRAFDPGRLERTFVLGTTDFAEIVVLPRLVTRLQAEAPKVDLVTRSLGNDVDHAIQRREIDLAYGTRFRPLAGITEETVSEEGMCVLLRKDHPKARRRLTAEAYAALDHVLVTPRGTPGGVIDRELEPLGLRRRVILRLPSFAAAALVVAQTDLVVTLPERFARRMAATADLRVVEVPFELPRFTFKIAFNSVMRDDPAHAWLRARVLEAARE